MDLLDLPEQFSEIKEFRAAESELNMTSWLRARITKSD
jgi:hypothetical protein